MSRLIMQQALDALEMHVLGFDGVRKMEAAIEALEQELAKPEQEYVRWFQQFGDAPPRKPWVGLTNEELVEIRETHQAHIFQIMFATEAKLRSKNDGSV